MNKKAFYVIGCPFEANGLFSIFLVCATHILYALKKGFIPVVDLKHYKNQYFKDSRTFKDNVWEYFFKQPSGFGLDDIEENSKVIISKSEMEKDTFPEMMQMIYKTLKEGYSKEYEEYFNKIEFNDEIQNFLDKEYLKAAKDGDEILGIICRGTDYTALRPNGHSIQPEVKDVIKKAKKLLERFKYKKIYLATEDADIYEKFKQEFGEILIENAQYKYSYNGSSSDNKRFLGYINVERENHAYNLAIEYLCSIYILSKCKYLIGGMTSALIGLWFISRGFKNQQYTCFWNIGKYHNSDIIKGGKFLKPLLNIKNILKEKIEMKLCRNRIIGFDNYIKKSLQN